VGRPSRNRVSVDDGITLIRRNASSKWTGRFFVRGRETWRASGLRVLEAAKPWALSMRERLELEAAGVLVGAEPGRALDDLIEEWAKTLRVAERSASYVRDETRKVREILHDLVTLDQLTAPRLHEQLERVRQERKLLPDDPTDQQRATAKAPLAARSLAGYVRALRQFGGWLTKTKRIANDPTKEIAKPRGPATRPRRALKIEEAMRLLALAPLERRVVYFLAMVTGLRRAELGALRWGNFELAAGRLVLLGRSTKNRDDAGLRLPPQAVALLEELRRARAASPARSARGGVRVGWQEADLALVVPANGQLRADLEAAGVEWRDLGRGRVVLHSLRDALATGLKDARVNPLVVSAAMRHKDVAMTLRTYTDLHDGEVATAVDELAALLAPALASDPGPNLLAPAVAPHARGNSGVRSGRAASAKRSGGNASGAGQPQVQSEHGRGLEKTRKARRGSA
jgi:integrase